jgi:hypothetical protein
MAIEGFIKVKDAENKRVANAEPPKPQTAAASHSSGLSEKRFFWPLK